VGQTRFFQRIFMMGTSRSLEAVVEASLILAEKKWGALIVIQRETGLRSYKEAGTALKAEVSTPLLLSIFNPGSPMHDGAVILQNTLIEAAGCILPLTESQMVLPEMGTRHRAALGMTEESDAIVVVVSEERGTISTAENGRFTNLEIDEMKLRRYLNERLFISSGD
jgi:diadenylate cyclase